jgi:protein ImuB
MPFAAIFIPNFTFQAIARCEPELRIQPVAVIEGQPPTYYVVTINRLAEKLGVAVGMTKANAEQFQHVQIRPRSHTQEDTAHHALLDAAWSVSSRVEDAAGDTLLLDLSGLARLFGTLEEIAQRILARTSELGMDAHVAVSVNVETARVIARALPGITVVPDGQERLFLETLPVEMLSPSAQLAEILQRWGVATCKALASLPVLSLSECVGQEGVHLHALANGKGNRPLLITQSSDCFEEGLELEDAVDNLEPLSFLLGRLLQQLCARTSARALGIAAIHVTFELQPAFESSFDSSPKFRSTQLLPPKTFSCTLKLPVPSQNPTLLLKLLRLRLQSKPPGAPVQKIHMVAEPGRSRATQSGLFVPASPDPQKLELTIARIAAVVGENNVGSPQLLDTHRPDAFHMRKFLVTSTYLPIAPHSVPEVNSGSQAGFRVFRPALPVWVQLQGKCPTRIGFQGMLGTVIRASGPWRTSGDWWEEQSWQEDAWDLEIHFASTSPSVQGPIHGSVQGPLQGPVQGLYRISYDISLEKWWMRGVYD